MTVSQPFHQFPPLESGGYVEQCTVIVKLDCKVPKPAKRVFRKNELKLLKYNKIKLTARIGSWRFTHGVAGVDNPRILCRRPCVGLWFARRKGLRGP